MKPPPPASLGPVHCRQAATASDRLRPLPIVLFYLLRYDINPLVGAVSSLEIVLALLVLLVGSRLLGFARIAQLGKRVT